MRPLSAFLLVALVPGASYAGAPSVEWASALRGTVEGLEPITAGQLPELEPGLMRLRGLDPADAEQRAALEPMVRALAARGYDAKRLASIRVDAATGSGVVSDLSLAWRAGEASARDFSLSSAELITRTRPRTAAVEFFAQTKARLDAMALLYGEETVRSAQDALRRKLLVIAQGDWGPEAAVAAAELASSEDADAEPERPAAPAPRAPSLESWAYRWAAAAAALAALSLLF